MTILPTWLLKIFTGSNNKCTKYYILPIDYTDCSCSSVHGSLNGKGVGGTQSTANSPWWVLGCFDNIENYS